MGERSHKSLDARRAPETTRKLANITSLTAINCLTVGCGIYPEFEEVINQLTGCWFR